jgi:hypothetical protein
MRTVLKGYNGPSTESMVRLLWNKPGNAGHGGRLGLLPRMRRQLFSVRRVAGQSAATLQEGGSSLGRTGIPLHGRVCTRLMAVGSRTMGIGQRDRFLWKRDYLELHLFDSSGMDANAWNQG